MNQLDRVSPRPEPFVSYSINYEDVILRRLFPGKVDGFFVDIGAQHPKTDNDLFGLYELGWTGINVEPNPSYFALLQTVRVKDRNLQLALSDTDGEPITFFEVEGSGLSTCDEQQAMACAAQGYTIRRHDLQTSTLRRVLGKENPPHIDIMKVDVEGFEEKVLAGNDWTLFRPSVILVESTYPETPVKRPTNIAANLAAVGYRHAHFDGLNDFYVEASFMPPPGAFAPPNVFDGFVRLETIALREETIALRQEFSSAETYAHALEAERRQLEKRLSEGQTEQASLQQRVLELEPLESAYRSVEQELERAGATLRAFRRILSAALLDKRTDLDNLISIAGHSPPMKGPGSLLEQQSHDPQSLVLVDRTVMDKNGAVGDLDIETLPPDLMIDLLRQRIRGLAGAQERLSSDIDDLRQENRRLLLAVSQLQGENLSLNRALRPAHRVGGELATMSAALERVCGRLEDDNARWMRDATRREDDVAEANRRSARAEASAAQARQMVEAFENSTSWRLTAPVRALGRLLKGRR
jgi:FkbM family methyltransferase